MQRETRDCHFSSGLLTRKHAADRPRPAAPWQLKTVDQPLFECHVDLIAEATVCSQRRRIIRPHVQDNLIAELQKLRGYGAGYCGSVPASTEFCVGHYIADHGQLGCRAYYVS